MPNTSSAVNASNKRVGNIATISNKNDSKLNNSQHTNNHSKGELDAGKKSKE